MKENQSSMWHYGTFHDVNIAVNDNSDDYDGSGTRASMWFEFFGGLF